MKKIHLFSLPLTLTLALSACHMKLDPPGVRSGYSPTATVTVQPTVTATMTPGVRMEKVNP